MTFSSLPQVPGFVLWYAWQLLSSSWAVLRLVPRRDLGTVPLRVVQVPLASVRDWQISIFGALITLTPGTLTLGVVREAGERYLLVHDILHEDNATSVADLVDMEARMLKAFPGRGGR